jgi:S1-C subfamily serine protease
MMRLLFLLIGFFPLASCVAPPMPRVDRRPPSRESFLYAQQRVSAIIVTRQNDITDWVRRGFPKSQTPPDTDGGTASPITPDGYFLTADHVVKNHATHAIHVLYSRGSRLKIARGRVVWRDAKNDIAILHAPIDTPSFYQFTSPALPIPEGTTVFHGGLTTGLKPQFGKLNTTIPAQTVFSRSQRFRIDIPLQPGDSGGPILDARAQLIGINSSVEFLIPLETPIFTESSGVRPNVPKIMKIIERDRRR